MASTSVTRALRILTLVAHADKPVTLKQIAEDLEIPKSTAHGILRDLTQERFIDACEPVGYTVGLKAFEVGAAHLRIAGVSGVISSELVDLSRTLDLTAHYAVLDGTEAVYLYKQDPVNAGIQLASSVGARLPSHLTAVGKCCLAWLRSEDVPEHVHTTRAEDPGRLREELLRVREHGHATDDGQVASGVQCIAAPVFDPAGPRGAVGISFLKGGFPDLNTATEAVRRSAARLTAKLGGVQR
ncbi:IclR family transcriptional regulator [Streptomyces sp. NPDC055105]|uniref:IclR family transcriptional regulator n=1 Tax=Streptomyces sp. NPDC055105 TaxID=3365719 RepID=UPI0037CEA684